MKNIPGLDKKIEKAFSAGYTADQILDFLKNQTETKKGRKEVEDQFNRPFTDEQGRLTEAQRQEKGERKARKESFLSQTLDPRRLGATAIGAGIGAATGGASGAVGGAIGGAEAYDDILRKYDQHKSSGGTMGLKDFLVSVIKGGAKATGASTIITQAQRLLENLSGNQENAEEPTPENTTPESPTPPPQPTPESPTPEDNFLNKKVRVPEQKTEEEIIELENTPPQKRTIESKREEKIDRKINPKGWSFESIMGEIPKESTSEKQFKVKPFESSLKSSNLSAATFDADTGKMRVVFRPREGGKGGDVYEYDFIDLPTFEIMTGGEARPVSEGSNKFGIWFNTKNPSVGANFDKYIKKNKTSFPYKQVEPKGFSVEESAIVEADRTHLASELFAPFAKQRLEGRQKQRANALKDIQPVLKNIDDKFLLSLVQKIETDLAKKLKSEPTVTRISKEFEKKHKPNLEKDLKKAGKWWTTQK